MKEFIKFVAKYDKNVWEFSNIADTNKFIRKFTANWQQECTIEYYVNGVRWFSVRAFAFSSIIDLTLEQLKIGGLR